LSPEGKKDRMIETMIRIPLKGSEIRPLIMVFEDLHWIDKSSEDVLKYVLESISGARIFLIFTYRPEFVHTWGGKSYHNQLNLNRLSNRESLAMVNYLLDTEDIESELEEFILEKTEGIPFFIEEFMKSLRDLRIIEKKDNTYRIAKDIQTVTIPATIQDVIMARVDSLPERAKGVLQTGSAVGREFSHDLINRVMELPEQELLSHLSALKDSELLYERGIYPQSTYIFKHALTQEVTYNSLLIKRRKEIHKKIGRAMEEISSERLEEFYEMLAYHFEQGEVWAKAVHYLLYAAEKAKEQYAYPHASHSCMRALEAVAHAQDLRAERVRGLALLGDLWSLMGDLEQANRSYEQALEAATDPTVQQWIANKRHRPHTVVRNGARIAFYEHGSGEPTLVLTNPITYGLATFQPVLEKLCQEFRVLTIDPRGTGASDPLQRPYTIKDHMEDMRVVIDASWAGPVVGVGISRGGNLLVRLAVAYPALVQGLVIVGTPVAQQGRRSIDKAQEFLRNNDLEGALRFWASLTLSEPGLEPLVERVVKARLALPRETILSFYDPDPEMDIGPQLGAIRVPTLVMHGTDDRNVPFEVGRYLAEHIPGAQFYAFKGRGHVPVSTATGEFCEVLRSFVRTGSIPEIGSSAP
jgi:pimeloyl-ACP methyl ester carboxylesterase